MNSGDRNQKPSELQRLISLRLCAILFHTVFTLQTQMSPNCCCTWNKWLHILRRPAENERATWWSVTAKYEVITSCPDRPNPLTAPCFLYNGAFDILHVWIMYSGINNLFSTHPEIISEQPRPLVLILFRIQLSLDSERKTLNCLSPLVADELRVDALGGKTHKSHVWIQFISVFFFFFDGKGNTVWCCKDLNSWWLFFFWWMAAAWSHTISEEVEMNYDCSLKSPELL